MVNISLSEKEARELAEFYETEYNKLQQRMNDLTGMLEKLKGSAPADAATVETKIVAPEIEAKLTDEPVVKVKKGRGKAKPKTKETVAEVAEETKPKASRGGYLRLDYEKFILEALEERGEVIHTNEFQELIISKNKLKGELIKKAEAGISRALSILKNQKNLLTSNKVAGKAGLSYGLVSWNNDEN